jgi:hypothetical protein
MALRVAVCYRLKKVKKHTLKACSKEKAPTAPARPKPCTFPRTATGARPQSLHNAFSTTALTTKGADMSFKTAREIFEKAQATALERGDESTEGIAAGLIELTKALSMEMRGLESKISSLEQAVRRLK